VEQAIERLVPALDRWEAEARPAVTDEVAAELERLGDALLEHLDEEEREILPMAARHVTQAEWDQLGQHGVGKITFAQTIIMFGAVLEEATPEERAEMLQVVPFPVRILMTTLFAGRYRRYITRVRAGR
jgi:alkylhydroperoxidase/carboxymuconolactone decarboxylase family protein YurZ